MDDVAKAQLFSGDTQAAFDTAKQALRTDSSATIPLLILGTIACEHHNYRQALQLAELAQQGNGDDGWTFALRGRALLGMSRLADARQAARATAQTAVTEPQIADMVGVLLSRTGLHAEAPAYFERAVAQAPDHPSYLYNLATALQFIGDLEGARLRYCELLAVAPDQHRARLALVQLERQTSRSNSLEELKTLFGEKNRTADDKLMIGHAIAKTLEDLNQWDESFDWLERAKAHKAAQSSFDIEAQDALFTAASASVAKTRDRAGNSGEAPIFIVGLPRTGTTLVERILSSHSQVGSAGELSDFGIALKRLAKTPGPYVLEAETLKQIHVVDADQLGASYLEGARIVSDETARFIDKMPFNFFYVPAILASLPHAHVICLRRNPADTVLSNFRQLFATGFAYYDYAYNLDDTAALVARFNRLADEYARELPSDRYREIAYEDIVTDQEALTRSLLDFCNLGFEPACLTPEHNARPVATASSVQVREPVYATSIARWKRYREAGPRIVKGLSKNGLEINS